MKLKRCENKKTDHRELTCKQWAPVTSGTEQVEEKGKHVQKDQRKKPCSSEEFHLLLERPHHIPGKF